MTTASVSPQLQLQRDDAIETCGLLIEPQVGHRRELADVGRELEALADQRSDRVALATGTTSHGDNIWLVPALSSRSPGVRRRRRAALWGYVALGGFFLFLIVAVTGYYFGTVHEELFDSSSGRTLDCGTIFSVNGSALATVNCGGALDGDVIGFVLMASLAAIAVAAIVVGTIRERSANPWR